MDYCSIYAQVSDAITRAIGGASTSRGVVNRMYGLLLYLCASERGKMATLQEKLQQAEALAEGKKINEAVDLLNALGTRVVMVTHALLCSEDW